MLNCCIIIFFFFKQKTAYEMRISDWSSDVCSSDLGNVRVTQAGMTLTAPRMTIAYTRSGGTDINRIDATGGVVVTKGDEMAKGNVAIYDLDRRLITMVGNVELRQRGHNLRGGRLVIAITTRPATVDGSRAAARPDDHPAAGGTAGRAPRPL